MNHLQHLKEFSCAEYFDEKWSEKGHFDEMSQTQVIVILDDAYINEDADFFAIGRSGAGGIDFGYRKGKAGLWAYYPIDHDFKFMANSIIELRDGWCSGQLTV